MSTCPGLPARVVGPHQHTLFLGASISAFDASLGWNNSSSEINVKVAVDGCGGSKVYYDGCTLPQIYTGADFFNPPQLGDPVYFQYGSFSFAGILQNWKEAKSTSETIYNIRITDPSQILDDVSVVLGGYNGSIDGVPNLLNVYGFLEEYNGTACPIDSSLAAMLNYIPAFGYGGSFENDAGVSWNRIRNALNIMCNATPPILGGKFGSQIRYRNHLYYLDLSELPYTVDDLRLGGDTTSLLSIIDEVCRYSGSDWFCSLNLLASGSASYVCNTGYAGHISKNMAKFIKLHVVPRQAESVPANNINVNTGLDVDTRLSLGKITSVLSGDLATQHSRGIELRNDVTNAVVIGDKRQDLWQVDYVGDGDGYNDSIWPYWGKDKNGYAIVGSGYNSNHTFDIDLRGLLPDALFNSSVTISDPDEADEVAPAMSYTYSISALELACALDGRSTWDGYMEIFKPSVEKRLGGYAEWVTDHGRMWRLVRGVGKSYVLHDSSRYSASRASSINVDVQAANSLYSLVEHYARDFFGKKFMVKLPVTCYTDDPNTPYATKINWNVTDGAWTENSVLGLANNSTELELFRLDDGRIGGLGKFSNTSLQFDLSDYALEDYIQPNVNLGYVKCRVDDIIFLDPVNNSGVRAVVEFDNPVLSNKIILDSIEYDLEDNLRAYQAALALIIPPRSLPIAKLSQIIRNLDDSDGADITNYGLHPNPITPNSIAVPLISTNLTYGPWKAVLDQNGNPVTVGFGSGLYGQGYKFGTVGKTEVEVNSELNPWSFGSTTNMNVAGQIAVNGKISNQEVIEVGNIASVGSPAYNLGDVLIANGPEITNIIVNIGEQGVTTSYDMRTFTPDYGSFAQTKIDSLKRQGEMNRKIQRITNLAKLSEKRDTKQPGLGFIMNRPDRYTRTSSHSILAGGAFYDFDTVSGILPGNVTSDGQFVMSDRVLNPVVATDIRKGLPNFAAASGDDWQRKAVMEMNGLLRPYTTTSGEQSLMAEFYKGNRDETEQNQFFLTPACPSSEYNYSRCDTYMHRGPVMGEGNAPIVGATLSPFLQPTSTSDISGPITTIHQPAHMVRFSLGSGTGHDIEYVARDGVYPVNLSVSYPSGNYSTQNWYRAQGLKLPAVGVGWGFDIYGKPVPNREEINGRGTTAYFEDDWLGKPQNWKAGPIDLRWDNERGVWTAPPAYRICQIRFLENTLAYNTSINAEIVDEEWPGAYDADGSGLDGKYIMADNPMGYSSISGAMAWAFYNPVFEASDITGERKYDENMKTTVDIKSSRMTTQHSRLKQLVVAAALSSPLTPPIL
jgi:hypothetical protein